MLFSRFGVMFFADPTAAFANLRRALRAGGRLAFVCWQALPENAWMAVPLLAALQHMPPPPLPGPEAPGPFAFADPARVRRILERRRLRDPCSSRRARDTDASAAAPASRRPSSSCCRWGPTAAALREATDPTLSPRVAAAVREALAPYVTADGVRMSSASWIVTARRRQR